MWNPWKHLRLAGALVIVVAALLNNIALTFIGLLVQYVGVIGGLDLLERKFDLLIEENKEEGDAIHK